MDWFGESLANLKSQVSSFTQEVLTEGREDEEFQPSDELQNAKKIIRELEALCARQTKEAEDLRAKATEWQERSEAQERQSKSSVESYEKILQSKEEENAQLRHQVNSLLLKQKEQSELLQKNEEEVQPAPPAIQINNVSTNTENVVQVSKLQVRDFATQTEPYEQEVLDDRLELEERCVSYQNDLFQLREELMTLQHAVDEKEVSNAKLIDEVLAFLHSDFVIDGQAALLGRLKTSHPFCNENLILAALKQLSYLWKDLVDRKGTLERAVAKLSVSENNSSGISSNDENDGRKLAAFLPPAVDSFGLETIIEDERGEEDNPFEAPLDDQPGSIAFIEPKPNQVQIQRRSLSVPLVSSFTQTEGFEQETSDNANSGAAELEELEEKCRRLACEVEERDDRTKKLETELERLRTHLVDLEEQATSEAVVSEEREKALNEQVAQLKAQIVQTLRENDKIVNVKEEVSKLTAERDAARSQNASYEEQIQKLGIQLQNLHFVLEQFQKEKETEISNMEKILRREINQLILEKQTIEKEVQTKEGLLEKARSGLEAAQQLSIQIEDKSRLITTLKSEVHSKEAEVEKLHKQIKEVGSNLDGKIDRYLVKNLIVGYFSTPVDKRKEVLRLIATVLDFNREDRQKTGLEAASIWPFRSGGESSADKPSLSEAFIRFLETESQPKVQVRMPTEEITRRSSRSSSSSTTLLGESPVSPSSATAETISTTSVRSSTSSPGVPEISMSLPVLNQADRSNSILKDVLNPKP